jgi:D-sedoheptulose 7-phosphate isomerase
LLEAERLRLDTTQRIRSQISLLHQVVDLIDAPAVEAAARRIESARAQGKMVFVIGNGGSASTASHFVTDIQKRTIVPGKPRLRALSLADNVSLLTAWTNDVDYGRSFAEPLRSLGGEGDVLVAISASGASPNILSAVEAAKDLGMTVIGLTGFEGAGLRAASDIAIHVPVASYELAEDAHHVICHLLAVSLFEEYSAPGLTAPRE